MSANTLLLLHCNDFNDTCNNYSVANNGVTISDEGKFGNCFNINQSYITFNKPIELNCNTGFTIDFWINPSQFDDQYQYHLSSGLNFVSYDKNKVYCSICGINKDDFYVNEPLPLNEFTHIAIVGENNVIKIFINGILKASKDAINTTQTFNTNNKFFLYQNGKTAHIPVCKIDEFRISNVASWQTDFEVPTREYGTSIIEKLSNESSLIDINNRNELLYGEVLNLKDELKNNLIDKDVDVAEINDIRTLISKLDEINIGRKWASGSSTTVKDTFMGSAYRGFDVDVSNLSFEPSIIMGFATNSKYSVEGDIVATTLYLKNFSSYYTDANIVFTVSRGNVSDGYYACVSSKISNSVYRLYNREAVGKTINWLAIE